LLSDLNPLTARLLVRAWRSARWKQREVIDNAPGANTFTVGNEVPLGCNSYSVDGLGARA
jgi:hypothetical protein